MGKPEPNGGDGILPNGAGKVSDVREGNAALDRLKVSEASEWLAAPPSLVQCAKEASELLFSLSAKSFEKAPLSKLYTDRFDSEQIWQQIDLQSHPILSYIRRKIKNLEKSSNGEFFTGLEENEDPTTAKSEAQSAGMIARQSGSDHEDGSEGGSDNEEMEDGLDSADGEEEGEEEEGDEDDEEGEEQIGEKNGVEDKFFKISEMEKFLDQTDAQGVFGTGGNEKGEEDDDDDDDDDEEDEEGEEGEDVGADTSDENEDGSRDLGLGNYEEFFGKDDKKKKKKKRKSEPLLDDVDNSEEDSGEELTPVQLESKSSQGENLSAHERQQEKIEKRMKQLEQASLDPKDWTQQGEVTAKRRPKNSALEVELDFEHNARPPPVITEEVTASLEDTIRARIAEGRFDDVERRIAAIPTAPREHIELDESKSQKGLGEIYEEEYMQKSGLAAAPTSASEALKKEAAELFKAVCSRLDALSHFHFAPKPVIEDMEVRADVPALAMEEVAPLAVSEASMLAPEEIFTGKDGLKSEAEFTHEERKRRRAQKKRKRKGVKKIEEAQRSRKKNRKNSSAPNQPEPTPGLKVGHSSYSKSTKVFAELDRAKGGKAKPEKDDKQKGQPLHASFLKL